MCWLSQNWILSLNFASVNTRVKFLAKSEILPFDDSKSGSGYPSRDSLKTSFIYPTIVHQDCTASSIVKPNPSSRYGATKIWFRPISGLSF